jgi:glycosyltransferase involved in cell wall biosynthesis
MRVMIDFTQIPLARTGVGVYADHLIEELIALLAPDDTLFVVMQSDEPRVREWAGRGPRVRVVLVPSALLRNRGLLLLFEQVALPAIAAMHGVEVLHSLHYTAPLIASAKRVVTIHDLTFLLFPELHTRGRIMLMPPFIRAAVRRAHGLVFVSESTQRDADRLVPGRRGLAAVAPLGVEVRCAMTEERIEDALQKLKVRRPFILNVGTIEPRKNVIALVHAFEKIAAHFAELTLVIAGKIGWKHTAILDAMRNSTFADRIRCIGFITDEERSALLEACELFVYPSLYEGFGLPLLEAMAAGAPVIGSNTSSIPEVVGDAGELVDPLDPEALARTMEEILSDAGRRARLRQAGRARAAMFPWRRTAERTYELYRAVCTSRTD